MIKKNVYLPILIFVLFAGLYFLLAAYNHNDLLFKPVWDIRHYQSIAEQGYQARPCDPTTDYPMGKICGNVGWFPGWPIVVRFLSLGQINLAFKIFPYIFALVGFVLFYNLLLSWSGGKTALIGTIALAATPSAFYYLTGFPYSFILFLFSIYLYYLYTPLARGRLLLLPTIALALSLTYPSAFLTAVIPLTWLLNKLRKKEISGRPSILLKHFCYYVIPFLLGPLLLSAYFYFRFDDFLLFVHFQEKYSRGWDFPLTVITNSLLQFPITYVENSTILFYGLTFIVFFRYRIKPELIVYLLVLFLFSPATGSVMSIYRHYLLLFPAAMVIGTSNRPLWLKLAYIAWGLSLAIMRFFPLFMKSRLI